jgi:putative acetyltransferase
MHNDAMTRDNRRQWHVVRQEAGSGQMRIMIDDLTGPEIAALLEEHTAELRSISPPESKHALDLDSLRKPGITFWTVWDEGTLVGCGALQDLGDGHAELKSMRVSSRHQRRGIASLLLRHIIGEATTRGYRRLSLETGSMPFFAPAHALYRKHGFTECGPFAGYRDDPNSLFMTRAL